MTKQDVHDRIMQIGIVPVVRAPSARQAMMAVEAVCLGGIPIAEITMTVPGALTLIRDVVKLLGSNVLVGAGTVLDAATARQCIDAGAEFIVSPGLDIPTVEFAVAEHVLVMAGVLTPTELMTALRLGADMVKIFPCGELGGADYIRALRGPFPHAPMVPTGGVNLGNAAEFILAGAAALGVGGELIQSAALSRDNTHVITERARRFVIAVNDARSILQEGTEAAANQR
jgi:2-dehydro-3-deoxyphosphogluconate aldolase/(4S)-4-hydroxy-2-oxoglutarate aldolase